MKIPIKSLFSSSIYTNHNRPLPTASQTQDGLPSRWRRKLRLAKTQHILFNDKFWGFKICFHPNAEWNQNLQEPTHTPKTWLHSSLPCQLGLSPEIWEIKEVWSVKEKRRRQCKSTTKKQTVVSLPILSITLRLGSMWWLLRAFWSHTVVMSLRVSFE